MTGLGAAMAGGNPRDGRADDDFYPTPPDATRALIAAEGARIGLLGGGAVWEPACGDGAMAAVLADAGFEVVASDLHDRGHGETGVDFLAARAARAAAIVTNPPFVLAEAFIRHALALDVDYLALLLKATYWHAAGRAALWRAWQPAAVYPLTWRPDFIDGGAPTMDCAWVVWTGLAAVETIYEPLAKPPDSRQGGLFG